MHDTYGEMMTTTKERLQADIRKAMKAGDNERRNTLRLMQAAIKQEEVDRQTELDEAGVQAVLAKQAKQRRESIADYRAAGRPEMAAQEEAELAVIEAYLPQMMSREEVEKAATAVIAQVGAVDIKSMGAVMAQLMPQLKGKADGRLVNEVVRDLLQQ
jgi:uncharacterized protein